VFRLRDQDEPDTVRLNAAGRHLVDDAVAAGRYGIAAGLVRELSMDGHEFYGNVGIGHVQRHLSGEHAGGWFSQRDALGLDPELVGKRDGLSAGQSVVRDFDLRHGDARGEQSNPDSVLRNDVPRTGERDGDHPQVTGLSEQLTGEVTGCSEQ